MNPTDRYKKTSADLNAASACDGWYSLTHLSECVDDIPPIGEAAGPAYSVGLRMDAEVGTNPSSSIDQSLKSVDRRTCHFCLRRWPDQWALRMHMRTHTQERPHCCPHCDYRAAHKSNLTVHLRKHETAEKAFRMRGRALTVRGGGGTAGRRYVGQL
ncbi:zinc finger-like [Tropilaelaps mercedesae]|uniref:Zinc finger-like n=1 Tax=Tropilaelaps mercedesae TaxID=418985 RepID=A0A1V9XUC9_9ACAR|nr:zinc finger-like [Tropilaelaps mercedesae]